MINDYLDGGLVLAELPSDTEWEFGGYAYGLEPLTLPHPAAPGAVSRFAEPAWPEDAYGDACRLIRLAGARTAARLPAAVTGELYWFRWITGHQVSFVSWRLMAQLIADVASGRITTNTALPQLRRYVRAYSAMLLYTGSCPRDIYHDIIRPSMRLRHCSFSGSWAPDYGPVRDLLRARRLPFPPSPVLTDFLLAVKLHQTIHDGIAAKLVPDGRSLLRASGARGLDVKLLHVIYDNYFFTQRAPVSRHQVVAQLLRRLMAITQDVAVNGLHAAGGDAEHPDELPDELRTAEVTSYADEFTDILAETACCASRLPVGTGRELLTDAWPTRPAGVR